MQFCNINFDSMILLSNHTLLCGAIENGNSYHLIQFQIDNNNEIKLISKMEKVHSSIIWQLAHLNAKKNTEKIISVSDDNYIKIYDIIYEN